MRVNWQNMLDMLEKLPVDTTSQQALIRAAEAGAQQPAVLVVGTEESDPMSLIPGGNPFSGAAVPACPVKCCYAEKFAILVENQQGEKERFHAAADYGVVYSADARGIKACTVFSPLSDPSWPPLLFSLPDGADRQQLKQLAAMANGCIFTAYAEAGSVGEAAAELSRLIQQDRSVLVLTHVENVFFPNDMLSMQLHGGKIPCLECDHTLPGEGGTLSVLRSAMKQLSAAHAESRTEDQVCQALSEASKLMDDLVKQMQDKHNQQLDIIRQYEEAERIFRAEASSRKYQIRALVSEDHLQGLQKDLAALVEALKLELPGMIREVVQECEQPKDVLKNLLPEYVSATLNDAVSAALDEIVDDHLLPGMNRIMRDTMNDYTRLTAVALQSVQEDDADLDDSFIRIAHLHIGDFHTPLAKALSSLLHNLLWGVLFGTELYGLAKLVSRLEPLITELVSDAVDFFLPTKLYGSSVGKAVIQELDNIYAGLMEQIGASIFPRLVEVLDDEYAAFIDTCACQLTTAADRHRQKARTTQDELARCEQAANTCRQANKGD